MTTILTPWQIKLGYHMALQKKKSPNKLWQTEASKRPRLDSVQRTEQSLIAATFSLEQNATMWSYCSHFHFQ